MIVDKIENINLYKNVPQDVVNFIKSLNSDIKPGKILLSEKNYVNVEMYNTKLLSDAKFEAHNNYIDIQILLKGHEKIYISCKDNLKTSVPYNPEKDIIFYSDNIEKSKYIELDGTNFVMLFPHEAHAPQVSVNNKIENVKKVVVKVHI